MKKKRLIIISIFIFFMLLTTISAFVIHTSEHVQYNEINYIVYKVIGKALPEAILLSYVVYSSFYLIKFKEENKLKKLLKNFLIILVIVIVLYIGGKFILDLGRIDVLEY